MNETKYIYNLTTISDEDIKLFIGKYKKQYNDFNNKKRELIIESIINKRVPNCFYNKSNYSREWNRIKNNIIKNINNYIKNLENSINQNESNKDYKYTIQSKGGRNFNYDFLLKYENNSIKFEFKFGCCKINDAPQLYSPYNPSYYLDLDFEKYWYSEPIIKIIDKYNEIIQNKINHYESFEEYKKEISNCKITKNTNVYYLKKLYKSNNKFNKFCKEISKIYIKQFIEKSNLNIDKLNNKLIITQKNKIYLLCDHKGNFTIETNQNKNYIIDKIKYKTHNSYICETKNNKKLSILLRWKNGNGILFPAFQIKEIKNNK